LILSKIYNDKFLIEDIKGYLIPAFKKLQGLKDFFQTLVYEADLYSKKVVSKILNYIKPALKDNGFLSIV
jgi:hemolysin-activating ACP:hemolysin acyltransferase